jgi:low temperature requirement protein LtrA
LIVAHPHDPIHAPTAIVAFAGPAIFLLGCAMFLRVMAARSRLAYLVAVAALAAWALTAVALHLNGLWLGVGVLAIMLAVAASARRG